MRPRIPDFRPHPKNEVPRDALDAWSEANWAKVPDLIRNDVEQHVRAVVHEQAPELLAKWRDQRARGISIGSDDPRFHLGIGMAVRNTCREQLLDGELPPLKVNHEGKPYLCCGPAEQGARNWDDYYFGVLAAIAA